MAIYKLEDLVVLNNGKKPSGSIGKFSVVGSGGIFGKTDSFLINVESIALPRKGTMNISWYNAPVWNVDTVYLATNKQKTKLILKYLFYLLKSKNKWKSMITGTTRPATTKSDWYKFEIELPPIDVQKKIIDIIEPIEKIESYCFDLIDVMKTIIKNTSIKEQKLKITDISNEIRNKQKNKNQVSAKVLSYEGLIVSNYEKPGTYKTNSFFTPENTLVINTIRTYLRKFAILPFDSDSNGTLIHLNIDKKHETSLLRLLLGDDFWNETINLSSGTKMPVIKRKDIMEIEVPLVENEISGLFNILISLNKMILKSKKIKEKIISVLIK